MLGTDEEIDELEEPLFSDEFNEMLSTPTGSATTEEEEDYDPGPPDMFDWTSVPETDHDPTRFDDLPEMDIIRRNIYIL